MREFFRSGRFIVCFSAYIFFLFLSGCSSSQQASGSGNFIAPGYKKKDYKKILVLALIENESFKRKIEDAVVTELKDRRYPVRAAHLDFPLKMKMDTAEIRKRVTEAGYDAAILVTYLGRKETIVEHAEYNGTMYSLFYGYYNVIDLDTRDVGNAFFQCDFFVKDSRGTQWRAPVRVNTDNEQSLLLQMIARNVRIQIVGDKII